MKTYKIKITNRNNESWIEWHTDAVIAAREVTQYKRKGYKVELLSKI